MLQAGRHEGAIAKGLVSAERRNIRSDRLALLSCGHDPSIDGALAFMHNVGRLPPVGGDEISSSPRHGGTEGQG